MTVTEFCGDPIFEAAARHWPEREHGWQGRLSDLLDAVRDSLEEGIGKPSEDDDEVDDLIADLRDAIDEIQSAASTLEWRASRIREAERKKAAA